MITSELVISNKFCENNVMTLRTLHLWMTSILVGILLGFFGAAAAHYFTAGIYSIGQVLEKYFHLKVKNNRIILQVIMNII